MRSLLIVLMLLCIIGVIACRKNFFGTDEDTEGISANAITISQAKEHFKGMDKELAMLHSDLADAKATELLWSKAMQVSRPGEDFVEVPIVAKRKRVTFYNFPQDSLKSIPDPKKNRGLRSATDTLF